MASCGWVLEVAYSFAPHGALEWHPLVHGFAFLGTGFNSFQAELAGAEALVCGLLLAFDTPFSGGMARQWYPSQ